MEFLAIDLGASSGRAIVGSWNHARFELCEVHRFSNQAIQLGKHLYWDFPALFQEIKIGIKKAYSRFPHIQSIAVDTWGVDFGLIDSAGELVGLPHSYRDTRTAGMMEEAFTLLSKEEIYSIAGNQYLEINTLFQLLSLVKSNSPQLQIAQKLLFMPDLIHYYLTRQMATEYTIASTSNLLDARTGQWSEELITKFNLPPYLFGTIVMPGTPVGKLSEEICEELGIPPIQVVAVGSHDTASAVATVGCSNPGRAYISCGTWSLMGVTLPDPVLTVDALEGDFTNEGGVDHCIRFQRNMTGLWILQEVARELQEQQGRSTLDLDWSGWIKEAEGCTISSIIDVDHPSFIHPESMMKAIQRYCIERSQPTPATRGELMKTILQSMAFKYREVMTQLIATTGMDIHEIQLVGGGSRNRLLCQLTADHCQVPVIAGPVEATAIGNILMQIKAVDGHESLNQLLSKVSRSFDLEIFYPDLI